MRAHLPFVLFFPPIIDNRLLPTAFLLAYDALVSHPISPLISVVAESLKSLAQELTDFRWDELAYVGTDQGSSEGGATSLDLKPILSKFREVELLMGRALSLARKVSCHEKHRVDAII